MANPFQKAERTKVKARMALDGPTGSGKTYTALMAAKAFAGEDGKIAVIDTERGSASLYAGDGTPENFQFDVIELNHFDPLEYVKYIKAAEDNGYDVLVIDSLSHAWEGEGGALDQVSDNAARLKGNSYAAWRTVTPKHRKLVDTMLQSDMHIITTMRSKMEYVQEKGDEGRTEIRKVGLAPVQRSGMEYEFTWVIDMDIDHTAVVTKSRAAKLADLVENKPDLAWFQQFYNWLVAGKEPPRTRKELAQFAKSIGLDTGDIAEALKKQNLEFSPEPDMWAKLTNAITEYAEELNKGE